MGRSFKSNVLAPVKLGVYNLERVYAKADATDISLGMSYFSNFKAQIESLVGSCPIVVAAGLYAALSPNNSEQLCLKDMVASIKAYKEDKWDSLAVHTYGHAKARAKRILDGEDPDLVLAGPKTNAFYHNILDPDDSSYVTIDGHMVNIWNNAKQALVLAGINKAEYAMIANGAKEVAFRKGIIPSQLQSILWLTWRRLHRVLYNPQYVLPFYSLVTGLELC